jgi:hypothetical protein
MLDMSTVEIEEESIPATEHTQMFTRYSACVGVRVGVDVPGKVLMTAAQIERGKKNLKDQLWQTIYGDLMPLMVQLSAHLKGDGVGRQIHRQLCELLRYPSQRAPVEVQPEPVTGSDGNKPVLKVVEGGNKEGN